MSIWVGAVLVLVGVGIPLVQTIVLLWNRGRLKSEACLSQFGILYQQYREDRPYGGVVVLIRRMVMIAVYTSLSPARVGLVGARELGVVCVCVIALLVDVFYPSLRLPKDQKMSWLSQGILVFLAVFSLMLVMQRDNITLYHAQVPPLLQHFFSHLQSTEQYLLLAQQVNHMLYMFYVSAASGAFQLFRPLCT